MEHMIPAWMLIPFAAQLLIIAVLPLTKWGEWWEHNLHKLYGRSSWVCPWAHGCACMG